MINSLDFSILQNVGTCDDVSVQVQPHVMVTSMMFIKTSIYPIRTTYLHVINGLILLHNILSHMIISIADWLDLLVLDLVAIKIICLQVVDLDIQNLQGPILVTPWQQVHNDVSVTLQHHCIIRIMQHYMISQPAPLTVYLPSIKTSFKLEITRMIAQKST